MWRSTCKNPFFAENKNIRQAKASMQRRRILSKLNNSKVLFIFGCVVLIYLYIVMRFVTRHINDLAQNRVEQKQNQEKGETSQDAKHSQKRQETNRNYNLDSQAKRKRDVRVENIIETLPNWPAHFLMARRPSQTNYNDSCARLPSFFYLKMNNLYWQHVTLKEDDLNVYLYSAHYDERLFTSPEVAVNSRSPPTSETYVRLLGMIDRFFNAEDIVPRSLCQFWYDDDLQPTFSGPASYTMLWNVRWGYSAANQNLVPVLITCPLSSDGRIPTVATLVPHLCHNATNALTVHRPLTGSNTVSGTSDIRIAVCVKGLLFPYDDLSARLVEWLELLKLLGADRVVMYQLAVHPNMSRVLDYYTAEGFVETIKLTLPGDLFNGQELLSPFLKMRGMTKRQNELVPYNDCLYRSRERFDYVLLLDLDEVILPTGAETFTWKEMLRQTLDAATDIDRIASICARNCFFFENVTDPNLKSDDDTVEGGTYMHILNHRYRSYNHSPEWQFVKCFHSTVEVVALHNHLPLQCQRGICDIRHFDIKVGQLQHYRRSCSAGLEQNCQSQYMDHLIKDDGVLKFKTELVRNVKSILTALSLL